MTPDVKRLREILARLTAENANNADDALTLTEAIEIITAIIGAATPPDGAAEREADEGYRLECGRCEGSGQFPEGRTCLRCGGNGYDPVQPKPTPAPTEAPAAGDAPDRFKNVSCVIQSGGGYGPRLIWSFDSLDDAHDAHRLFRAALAARPAAVTDEMIVVATQAWEREEHRHRYGPKCAMEIFTLAMTAALTAAPAARGPA